MIYSTLQSDFVNVDQFYIEEAQNLEDLIVYQDKKTDFSQITYYLLYKYDNQSQIKVYDDELNLLSDDYITSKDEISTMTIYNNYLYYAINNTIYRRDLINGDDQSYKLTSLNYIDNIYIDNNILYATDINEGLIINSELVKFTYPPHSKTYLYNGQLIAVNNQQVNTYNLTSGKQVDQIQLSDNTEVDKLNNIKLIDDYAIVLYDQKIFYRNLSKDEQFHKVNLFQSKIEDFYTTSNQIYAVLSEKPILIHFQNRKEL